METRKANPVFNGQTVDGNLQPTAEDALSDPFLARTRGPLKNLISQD